jgi:hypothetical protein
MGCSVVYASRSRDESSASICAGRDVFSPAVTFRPWFYHPVNLTLICSKLNTLEGALFRRKSWNRVRPVGKMSRSTELEDEASWLRRRTINYRST